jgi:acyl carrier protein
MSGKSQCLATVLEQLRRIAPEVEVGSLDARQPLRDQVDLDSMDWLNFLIALSQTLEVDIPEQVYERLRTLDDLVEYLTAAAAKAAP